MAQKDSIPFVPHPMFASPKKVDDLFKKQVRVLDPKWYLPFLQGEGPSTVPEQPWSREEEITIFLQWNYARKMRHENPGMESWEALHSKLRARILEANLGLVCVRVTKYRNVDRDRDDAIAECESAVLRAMDKFDVRRGYKFSTYACRAIFLSLVRRYETGSRRIRRFGTQYTPMMDPKVHVSQEKEDRDHLWDTIMKTDLTGPEMDILQARFFDSPTPTLEAIGVRMGVCKERVRQIQASALAKLKETYERTLTGDSSSGMLENNESRPEQPVRPNPIDIPPGREPSVRPPGDPVPARSRRKNPRRKHSAPAGDRGQRQEDEAVRG